MENSMPTPGTLAPDFTLLDQDGKEHTLSSYKGMNVLLYFYPKDDTPGCTKQACAIRDAWAEFEAMNCIVLGISTDGEKSHKKFEEKYTLPFTLLADTEKTVVKNYGVWAPKKFMGRDFLGTLRTSFLINAEGNIAKVYEKVKPDLHAEMVLHDLKDLQS
jgi:peroxiredoxin Q/BCP